MGGIGSGNRWRYGAKSTTEDYRALDVRRLARAGVLAPGSSHSWQWTCNDTVIGSILIRAEHDRVTLVYRCRRGGDDWQNQEYPVGIVRSLCNLGGSRPWFLCPARSCGRRVAILYGGPVFACRRCHQLSYTSSREDIGDRAARRADRIRARLGWEPGILNGRGIKPLGMRWHTFRRMTLQHDRFVMRSLRAAAAQFGFLERMP